MRDLDKEQEQILNGNRFVVNTSEETGVFLRDVDKLFHQYRNLRLSIYNQYKGYLPDPVSRGELWSYIDEQFVRLVKEYHINGPIDFPGYIKTKLNYRVKHSYIKGEYRDRQRVFIPREAPDVVNIINQQPNSDAELDYYEVLEYMLSSVEMTDIERKILFYLLQELPESQIEKNIKEEFASKDIKIKPSELRETIKEVQIFIKTKLGESFNY